MLLELRSKKETDTDNEMDGVAEGKTISSSRSRMYWFSCNIWNCSNNFTWILILAFVLTTSKEALVMAGEFYWKSSVS